MPELGRAALVVTLGLALYALVAGVYAGIVTAGGSRISARNALIAAFGSTLVAAAVLAAGFLRSDFSLTYVAEHSNRSLSGPYKLSAFWGGQEGSLLLWLLILTGYCGGGRLGQPRRARDLVVWVTPVLGRDRGRFRVPARRRREPVRRPGGADRRRRAQPEPAEPVHDGAPAVPLPRLRRARGAVRLRDGALLSGRTDERWIVATRRWTLLAWTALGIGSCSARTGRTSRSAGAATTPGTRSRTPR